MNLGLSIFLSSIILGTILLYIATKDRWDWKKLSRYNWKKIIIRTVIIVISISIISGLAIFIGYKISNAPKKMNEFLGISLKDTKEDILFLKGEPSEITEHGNWIYEVSTISLYWDIEYKIWFKDEKIHFIECYNGNDVDIQGIGLHSPTYEITDKFGLPSDKYFLKDKLEHLYLYEKFHVFFHLGKNKVLSFGINNPEKGPLPFIGQKKDK